MSKGRCARPRFPETDDDQRPRGGRNFYNKLSADDAPGALGLMATDVEWTAMWRYKVDGCGPEKVAEGLFKPLMAEWSSFSLVPPEFITEGETVVPLGDFTGVHGTTGKTSHGRYARRRHSSAEG